MKINIACPEPMTFEKLPVGHFFRWRSDDSQSIQNDARTTLGIKISEDAWMQYSEDDREHYRLRLMSDTSSDTGKYAKNLVWPLKLQYMPTEAISMPFRAIEVGHWFWRDNKVFVKLNDETAVACHDQVVRSMNADAPVTPTDPTVLNLEPI